MSIDNAVDAGMSGNSPGCQQEMTAREVPDDHDGESEKLTNYERAARIFDLIEEQNGSRITMRQIHCFVSWLTSKYSHQRIDWGSHSKDDIMFRDLMDIKAEEDENCISTSISPPPAAEKKQNDPGQESLTSLR